MSLPWFRLYAEFVNDPKVQQLSEADQRRYIMLLCIRCSNGDVTLQCNDIAFQLRVSDEEWARTRGVFLDKKLITKDNKPTSWEKRQFRSDSSAERVSRHREKKKRDCNVTGNADVTKANVLDTDTDTEVNLLSGKPDGRQKVLLANGKAKFQEDATIVLEYLNEKSGKSFRAVKVNLELIAERMKEGATSDSCRRVIDRQCDAWKSDAKMSEYLRPATLFAKSNFWNYEGATSEVSQPVRYV